MKQRPKTNLIYVLTSMDDYLTGGYSEPCGQCGVVDWGVSDAGEFFCRNCHTVIEKSREVEDEQTLHRSHNRISTVKKSHRKSRQDSRDWMVCEGFQFVLKLQAEALVSFGVCSQFKTDVLWSFWKIYLQNTKQAFTQKQICTAKFPVNISSGSEQESVALSGQSTVYGASSGEETPASACSSIAQSSVWSGSSDASSYVNVKARKSYNLMTMPRTLAMCYLALLWVREGITLADLLRLVTQRYVPYLNIHENFPAEMRLYGRDATIFRVESFPSYSTIHKEAIQLAELMKLPRFPTVSPDCLLHPIPLTIRYLLELNLPDGLLFWVRKVIDTAAIGDRSFLTFNPVKQKPDLLFYDVQAAAVIIVTMKLLFRLDDQVEWYLSWKAANDKRKKVFCFRRWFKIMQSALGRARQKKEQEEALQKWKSSKPFIPSLKNKSVVLKKRRVTEHLQYTFQKLIDSTPEQQSSTTTSYSSFQFRWGKEEGSDGPSMHHHRLICISMKRGIRQLINQKYWHQDLKLCLPKECGDHFVEIEPTLPRMYVWFLDLFSCLLEVSPSQVHKEVLNVERRFLLGEHKSDMTPPPRKKSKLFMYRKM